jgi:hypothetical protein
MKKNKTKQKRTEYRYFAEIVTGITSQNSERKDTSTTHKKKKDELLSKITDGKHVSKESSYYIFPFFIYFRQ